VEGIKTQYLTDDDIALKYASMVVEQNKTIPLILTNEKDSIVSQRNLDSAKVARDSGYQYAKLREFRSEHDPVVIDYGYGRQHVYYGESYLLKQLRYYPYVQLLIITLFLLIVLIAFTSSHRSIQNQVWVGLSKETAHQLGTPLSSIEAWLELLKDQPENAEPVAEMRKDLDRLKLVADRFGKVGSTPKLEQDDLVARLRNMVGYMQKRAPNKVAITMHSDKENIPVLLSGPLFDWVIENLLRNALDAMAGKGNIGVRVTDQEDQVLVDISDDGKGIPKHQVGKIFNPGFTTKKRGWGLGLSLSKRIVEKYHHGSLYVKSSEVGKGTTFRIILRK
jgi:signal transduction histidine kinase